MSSNYRYAELEAWLHQGIRNLRWSYGERLPSIRQLCQQHRLSRATVQHALQRLEAQGVVESRPRSGYFVTLAPIKRESRAGDKALRPPLSASVSELLLDLMRRRGAFDLVPMASQPEKPASIVALNRAISRVMRRQDNASHVFYDEPAGAEPLRHQIARHYSRRGCALSADQLCITSGCQHALSLALQASCKAGDVVAVESPGFYGSLQLLEQMGLKVLEIPCSVVDGISTQALEKALAQWRIKACIVSPAFATPTGALMPEVSRAHLLDLAEAHDFAVIEDDIYADTALGPVPPPLKAQDRSDRVILCSAFSKSLSRDLRLGWVVGGRWHSAIEKLKLVNLLAGSQSVQLGTAEFVADGGYVAHLRKQRELLRGRRDTLLNSLRNWPGDVQFSEPRGGLAVWVELPGRCDTGIAYHHALAAGMVIAPGSLFSPSNRFRNCLRIAFEQPWDEARQSALRQLPRVLRLD